MSKLEVKLESLLSDLWEMSCLLRWFHFDKQYELNWKHMFRELLTSNSRWVFIEPFIIFYSSLLMYAILIERRAFGSARVNYGSRKTHAVVHSFYCVIVVSEFIFVKACHICQSFEEMKKNWQRFPSDSDINGSYLIQQRDYQEHSNTYWRHYMRKCSIPKCARIIRLFGFCRCRCFCKS